MALIVLPLLPAMKAPSAEPPIISTSIGLEQDAEMAAHEGIATEHGAHHNEITDKNEHARPLSPCRHQIN